MAANDNASESVIGRLKFPVLVRDEVNEVTGAVLSSLIPLEVTEVVLQLFK